MRDGGSLLATTPARAPGWLLGEGAVQVWAVDEARPFVASVLVRPNTAVILVAARLIGTSRETSVIRWAMERIGAGCSGYFEHEHP